MIVLDASAVVELVLGTRNGGLVSKRLASPQLSLHAPHLLDVEVVQVLRRYARTGAVTSARAEIALRDLSQLGVRRHEHAMLLPRVWELRANLTAYDAVYVALAEALDAPLLTWMRASPPRPVTERASKSPSRKGCSTSLQRRQTLGRH